MKAVRRHRVLALSLLVVASCGETETSSPPVGSEPADGSGTSTSAPSTPPPASATTDTPAPAPSPPSCDGLEKLSGDVDWTVTGRTVHVHVPDAYDPAKRTPVVLNFHGYTSNGMQQAEYSGMNAKADSAGFVAIHPEGTGALPSWNAGACCGTAASGQVDDVGFVNAILDELGKKVCVDTKRVFATGLSNGGFLSHRLACELSARIAAIAPVAGVVGVASCAPGRPVPVMQFHGTSDPLVPYGGNPSIGYPPVPETVAKWAERNGCTDAPKESFQNGDVQCMTQSQCSGGAEVTLCTVDKGGHTWPGSAGSLGIPGLGKTTQAIAATDAMWGFFQKHPMP